jgi:hypothetical protein
MSRRASARVKPGHSFSITCSSSSSSHASDSPLAFSVEQLVQQRSVVAAYNSFDFGLIHEVDTHSHAHPGTLRDSGFLRRTTHRSRGGAPASYGHEKRIMRWCRLL